MSNITRRAILAGSTAAIATAAASALPAIASVPAEPAGELPALVARWAAVTHQACDATDAREQCEIAARETMPEPPPHETFGYLDTLNAKSERQRQRMLHVIAKREAREQEAYDTAGWRPLKAREDALDDEADQLRDAIIDYPARTMGDVAAKVRLLGHYEYGELIDGKHELVNLSLCEEIYLALLADAERLAAKGSAA